MDMLHVSSCLSHRHGFCRCVPQYSNLPADKHPCTVRLISYASHQDKFCGRNPPWAHSTSPCGKLRRGMNLYKRCAANHGHNHSLHTLHVSLAALVSGHRHSKTDSKTGWCNWHKIDSLSHREPQELHIVRLRQKVSRIQELHSFFRQEK